MIAFKNSLNYQYRRFFSRKLHQVAITRLAIDTAVCQITVNLAGFQPFPLSHQQKKAACSAQGLFTKNNEIVPLETCQIPENDTVFERYHDIEWGVPVADDSVFFEKICLEGFQSGLSWQTVLHKREDFRAAFDYFCPETIAGYSDRHVAKLMQNERIIRNERKIRSTINNARCFLELSNSGVSLSALCWSFEPPHRRHETAQDKRWLKNQSSSPESAELAATLKKQGWSFIGPTNMYALMQALGIVNDHAAACPQRPRVSRLRKQFKRPALDYS
jgi:DNA-3-methyladenine glycosylase I